MEAPASSGIVFTPGTTGVCPELLATVWSLVRTREGGRERDLSTRAGPDEGGWDMDSGEIAGADIRRSGGYDTGGIMDNGS